MLQELYTFNLGKNKFPSTNFYKEVYQEAGRKILAKNSKDIKHVLTNNTNTNGIINATNIQNAIFPKIDCDIFLSHSSEDSNLAYNLAGLIDNQCKKSVFIDSALWGNMYELEKEINNTYSILEGEKEEEQKSSNKLFDYQKVLRVASNTRMILCTALFSMILSCKYFVFLNTNNSLNEDFNTNSPWIYYELYIANNIQKYFTNFKKSLGESVTEDAKMSFDVKKIVNDFKVIHNEDELIQLFIKKE